MNCKDESYKKIFKWLWRKWKNFSRVFARLNFNLIMTFFYWLIIGPVSLMRKAVKVFSSQPNKESYWLIKKEDVSNFKNQF